MENLKYSLFDLFAYTLPGILVLLMMYLFFQDQVNSIQSLFLALGTMTKDANIYEAVLVICLAYFTGYVNVCISYVYLRMLQKFSYFNAVKPKYKPLL